jgi:hypothetical protein
MPNGVSVRWIISIREHQNWTIVSIQFSKVTLEGLWKSRLIDQAVVLCVLVLALQHALEQIYVYDCDQELPTTPLTYFYVEKYRGVSRSIRWMRCTLGLRCRNRWSAIRTQHEKPEQPIYHATSGEYLGLL